MIKGLDGIRAIAFLLVFAFHLGQLPCGWIGVPLFFVLSGFLITRILLNTKEELAAKTYFINFYGRRILRIFPLYYAYLFIAGLAAFLYSGDEPYLRGQFLIFREQFPYALTYTYDFFHSTAAFKQSYFLSHLWSLSIEEQFYLIWPAVILVTPRRFLRALLWAVIIACPLLRGSMIVVHYYWATRLVMFPLFVYVLPFSHFDAFAVGALVSRVEVAKPKVKLLLLTLLVPTIAMLAHFIELGSVQPIIEFGYEPFLRDSAYRPVWGYSLLNLYFALVVYCVAFKGLFRRALELSFVRFTGRISYGLYVFHLPCIWVVSHILMQRGITNQLIHCLVILPVTYLFATASYYCMEQPLLRMKDRLFPVRTSYDKELSQSTAL